MVRTYPLHVLLPIAVSLPLASVAFVSARADAPTSLADRIRSPDEQARVRAAEDFVHAQEETIDALIAVIKRPTSPSLEWLNLSTPENLAIRVLGEMRAAKAVPELIPWLVPPKGGFIVDGSPPPGRVPAVVALVAIGKPAEPALINVLKQAPETPAWEPALVVLQRIEGRAVLAVILKEAIAAEKFPEANKNLAEALARLEPKKTPKKAP